MTITLWMKTLTANVFDSFNVWRYVLCVILYQAWSKYFNVKHCTSGCCDVRFWVCWLLISYSSFSLQVHLRHVRQRHPLFYPTTLLRRSNNNHNRSSRLLASTHCYRHLQHTSWRRRDHRRGSELNSERKEQAARSRRLGSGRTVESTGREV